jgi:hypothetical protein
MISCDDLMDTGPDNRASEEIAAHERWFRASKARAVENKRG